MSGFRATFRDFRSTIIWRLIVQQRVWVGLFVLAAAMSTGTLSLEIGSIKDAIDKAIVVHQHPLSMYVGRLAFAAVGGFFTGLLLRSVSARIGYHLEYEVRVRLYRRLQAVNPRTLDTISTGQLVTRAVTDLQMLELFVLYIPQVAAFVVVLLALAVIVTIQAPQLAVFALATIPINGWLVLRIRRKLLGLSWMSLHRRAEVTTAIDEAVRGIRVVKFFGREDHERSVVKERAAGAFSVTMNRVRLMARYDLILRAVPAIITSVLLLVAGRLATGGSVTLGKLLILLVYSVFFTSFAQQFGDIANIWQLATAAAKRITELLDLVPAPQPDNAIPVPPSSTGLVFEHVGFEAGGRRLIDGLSLSVRPGSLVVLTGRPGSGKSLSAGLAGGSVVPTSGRIRLDGADLADLDILDVRRHIRVLSEEPFIFGRTVRQNLDLGTVDGHPADDAVLWEALRVAAADGVVRDLPDGLDTVLGDRGMTLSGGQRQRLALARSMVAPPRVLVLDDALAAVNPALELEIVGRLRAHAPAMAVLCITRREGLERMADEVVRLPDPVGEVSRARPAVPTVVTADGMAGAMAGIAGALIDEKLMKAIAALPAERDQPSVPEAAVADERPPSVLRMVTPVRRLALVTVGFLLLYTLAGLVPQGLIKIATDDYQRHTHHQADMVALAIFFVAIVVGVFSFLFRLNSGRVNESILYVFRRRVFERLSRLGVDYYDRELPGRVAARVVYDLDRISDFLDSQANGIYQILQSVALFVVAAAVILVWNPSVGAVVAPFLPLMLLLTFGQVPIAARLYDRQRAALGSVVERFQEDLAGRYVIDAFGSHERADTEFVGRTWSFRTARRNATWLANSYIEAMSMMTWLASAALIARAGHLAITGVISVGSMVALELYVTSVTGPVPLLSDALQRLMAAKASFRTLSGPFVAPVLPVESPDAVPCPPLAGDIVLRGVDFAYPGTSRVVLSGVDLEIPPGTSVALVGPTGAGKSSVAKLIARIYDPVAGVVSADGHDLREFELVSFRRHLGIVPQDAFCFRGTVADNISYGRPDATKEQLEAAVDAVGGRDVLSSLPAGLRTTVEEEGRNLTAAQRQVIALARAIVTEPDIIILDEATSSLDGAHEESVLEAIRQLGRTTIFITHRLPVAQRADRVVVVDEGRIVEQGTHADLIMRDGAYAGLWAVGPEVDADVVEMIPTAPPPTSGS